MPQNRSVTEKKRTTIYLELELLEKFQATHSRFGDFSNVVNDLLREYLRNEERKAQRASAT